MRECGKISYSRTGADGNRVRRMRLERWLPNATETHSGCVILIALPLQQRLSERASILRYT
jgi:hypothetical protein